MLAWIAEKFRTWTDCNGDPESVISRDHLLANVSLYWFTGAIGSSFWPYYARMHGPWPIPTGGTVDVPMGYCAFPKEIIRPPTIDRQQQYTNIQRWTQMPKGGHFAAMEQPEALAAEIQAFFRAQVSCRALPCTTVHAIDDRRTLTSIPRKSFGLPVKLPFSGTAWDGSRVTATRIRLRSLTTPLVGSNGTQPAPGR